MAAALTALFRRLQSRGLLATLARGASVALILQGLGQGLRYLAQVLMARWMGADSFGAYTNGLNWAQSLAVVATLGFDLATLRYIPEQIVRQEWGLLRGFVRRTRQMILAAGMLIALASSALVMAINPARLSTSVLALSLWIVPFFALADVQSNMTRGIKHIGRAYVPTLLVRPLLLIGLGFGVVQIVGALPALYGTGVVLATFVIVAAVQAIIVNRSLPAEARQARPLYRDQEWLRTSLPMLASSGFGAVLARADILLIGLLISERQAGIYSAAMTTASLVAFGLLAINSIAVPTIASLHAEGNQKGLQRLVSWVTLVLFITSAVLGAGLIAFGRPVLGLFGQEFRTGYAALALWVIAQAVNATAGPNRALLNMTGHQVKNAQVLGISAALNLILNVALIPLLGITGAALAGMVTAVLWNVWLSVLVWQRLRIRSFFYLLPGIGAGGEAHGQPHG